MRADSLGRWCARIAVASALGAAAFAFAAGPAVAADSAEPPSTAGTIGTEEIDWQFHDPGFELRTAEIDWQ